MKSYWILFIAALLGVVGIVADHIYGNVFSAGSFSINYFAAGDFAIGVFAAGKFSIGIFSAGLFSVGIFSIGIFNVGFYAVGIFLIGWKKNRINLFKPAGEQPQEKL